MKAPIREVQEDGERKKEGTNEQEEDEGKKKGFSVCHQEKKGREFGKKRWRSRRTFPYRGNPGVGGESFLWGPRLCLVITSSRPSARPALATEVSLRHLEVKIVALVSVFV